MSCPAPRWKRSIPLYEAGLLEPEETAALERHLLECPECSLDVFGMQPVIECLQERDDLQSAGPRRTLTVFIRRHRSWATAAVLLMAAAIAYGLFRYLPRWLPLPPTSPAADISRVFQEVDFSQLRPPLADRSPAPAYRQALDRFEAADYRSCLEWLSPVLAEEPVDPAAVLLASRCRLALGEKAEALDLLNRHPVGRGEVYFREYEWLKVEALLGLGRRHEARAILQELSATPGAYQDQSGRLLQLLP